MEEITKIIARKPYSHTLQTKRIIEVNPTGKIWRNWIAEISIQLGLSAIVKLEIRVAYTGGRTSTSVDEIYISKILNENYKPEELRDAMAWIGDHKQWILEQIERSL